MLLLGARTQNIKTGWAGLVENRWIVTFKSRVGKARLRCFDALMLRYANT